MIDSWQAGLLASLRGNKPDSGGRHRYHGFFAAALRAYL
jgi:hypothetical protein